MYECQDEVISHILTGSLGSGLSEKLGRGGGRGIK